MKKIRALASAVLITVIVFLFSSCSLNVAEPSVKEGRFNYTITYEVDGELETFSGVFVCKYAGIGHSLEGSYREWDSYFEEGQEKKKIKETEDGDIYIDLRFVPSYFMSDPSFEDQVVCGAEFYIEYNEQHNEEFGLFYSYEIEVVESYGVKLISSEIDPPIANEYK